MKIKTGELIGPDRPALEGRRLVVTWRYFL
jgi:hypothetical protein